MKRRSHIGALFLSIGLVFGGMTAVQAQLRIAPSPNLGETVNCYAGGRKVIRRVDQEWNRGFEVRPRENNDVQKVFIEVARHVERLDATIYTVAVKNRILAEACDSDDGMRYILFNPSELLGVYNNTGSNRALEAIIAHEIGHFVLGHHVKYSGSEPGIELEADRYAGKLLARMGASLEEVQSAYEELKNTQGPTHPPISERLKEIRRGFEEVRPSIQPSPGITNRSEVSSGGRENTSEAILQGPVETNYPLYMKGPDNRFKFRFKAIVVGFNEDKDLKKAADKGTDKKGTHVWDNKYYYWTKKNPKDRLLLAWANLTDRHYAWVVVENYNGHWFYKTDYDSSWTNLKRGEWKTITRDSSGQIINISLHAPELTGGWTTEDIQYSFGYSN